jgi:hypothetical protein
MASLITAFTAGTTSAQAVPARMRRYLGIFNESGANTVLIAFDQAATASAAATAGMIVLQASSGGNVNSVEFYGEGAPDNAINISASAGSSLVTIVEGL